MPLLKITQSSIKSIPSPQSSQTYHWDTCLTGFGICVNRKTSSFVVQARMNGKTIRHTIGRCNVFTLDQARTEARKFLYQISTGINPIKKIKEEKLKKVTLQSAFIDYLAARKDLKPRTIKDYKYCTNRYFDDWKDRPLLSISKSMASLRHAKLGQSSKAQANYAMRILRAVFNFAMAAYDDHGGMPIIPHNPVNILSQTRAWYKVARKRTWINRNQLPALFNGINSLKETQRDFLTILIFTGLRPWSEAARMEWEWIDFQSKTFCIPDTKNSTPHTLPMGIYIHELLERRKGKTKSKYVFPLRKNRHIREPLYELKKVIHISGIKFCLYDLRRTFVTIAESLDLSYYSVKRLLNHKISGDVTEGYIVTDPERLRKPIQKIEDYILRHSGIEKEDNIRYLFPQ